MVVFVIYFLSILLFDFPQRSQPSHIYLELSPPKEISGCNHNADYAISTNLFSKGGKALLKTSEGKRTLFRIRQC